MRWQIEAPIEEKEWTGESRRLIRATVVPMAITEFAGRDEGCSADRRGRAGASGSIDRCEVNGTRCAGVARACIITLERRAFRTLVHNTL
jgi:hypothetical protein